MEKVVIVTIRTKYNDGTYSDTFDVSVEKIPEMSVFAFRCGGELEVVGIKAVI